MSAEFLAKAFDLQPTKPIDKLIAIYLANHCSDGLVTVHMEDVSIFCGRSEKAVRESFDRLQDEGHIMLMGKDALWRNYKFEVHFNLP